ncbi:MAG: CDGSH iron-sulfur domain-containing protein [Ignavibacteria bacterium]|nr:CDGSH iron-sulfur domain-containing protein [Ignavibacteria bacterium]
MAPKITVMNNSNLRVEGEFELLDQSGKPFDLKGKSVISLCRCGHSKNKPFCDGSHRQANFQSAVDAPPSDSKT